MSDLYEFPFSPAPYKTALAKSTAAPSEAPLHELLAYWVSLRGAHPVPLRRDIDPRRIDRILPHVFILERIAPGLARFRVAGTGLADLMGMDVRAMPISTLIEPAGRGGFADDLQQVFDRPARLRLDLASKGGFGRPALTGAMLLLPLRGEGGAVSRALGAIVAGPVPGRTPRRFTVTGKRADPIPGRARARRDPAPAPKPPRPAPGQAHLRLVVSN